MSEQGNITPPHRIGEVPDLRLVVGAVKKTVLTEEDGASPLWMAVALDGDGGPAALGLYKGAPTVGEVMALLGGGQIEAHELGPLWPYPEAAVAIVDHAVLWQANETRGRLAARGTSVYASAPAGRDREQADQHFSTIALSLAAAFKRGAHGRDGKGAALITPHAAAAAAREWRAAREAAEAGDLTG